MITSASNHNAAASGQERDADYILMWICFQLADDPPSASDTGNT
jgi:hypothetical protein